MMISNLKMPFGLLFSMTNSLAVQRLSPFGNRIGLVIVCQGERTKFDRFVDLNVRGAQRGVDSDLRIYRY